METNKKSFYDWCIDNNETIYLDNWNYERNQCSPKDCSYGSANKIYFKCPRGIHDDTLKPLNNITNISRKHKDNYCLKCNSFEQWCIDNDKQRVLDLWDYDLNVKHPIEIGYCSNESYYFKCEKGIHQSHKHALSAIVDGYDRIKCQYCESVGQFGIDNIENFIEKYWSINNSLSPFEIATGCKKYIKVNCQICGQEYSVRTDHFINGVRHKGCSLINGKSKLQKNVEDYILEKYSQYTLLHENKCTLIPKSPLTNYNMYFDNEVKELHLIVEVHGQQHYKTCSWDKKIANRENCTQKEIFEKRKLYDEYKKNEALKNGYSYLEIPYWTENDESYKMLIDDKIKGITKEVA